MEVKVHLGRKGLLLLVLLKLALHIILLVVGGSMRVEIEKVFDFLLLFFCERASLILIHVRFLSRCCLLLVILI